MIIKINNRIRIKSSSGSAEKRPLGPDNGTMPRFFGLLLLPVLFPLTTTAQTPQATPRSAAQIDLQAQGPQQWVNVLETRADGSALLAHSNIRFTTVQAADRGTIVLRLLPAEQGQSMDGFGASLTESSASLLMKLSPAQREQAMREMFVPSGPLGLTLLREPIGASDFSAHGDYSYDDIPAGQTDPTLEHFSAGADEHDVFPLLREALSLNPQLRFIILPWSAPAWMKTSHSMNGGSLENRFLPAYAQYLAHTVELYAQQGLPVYAMALQNEPLNQNHTYPTQLMPPAQEAALAAAVRPLLRAAGRTTLLLGYEHNWNNLNYPSELLSDAAHLNPSGSPPLFDGISFHCYAGDASAQREFLREHPGVNLWFTECSGTNGSTFAQDLMWQAKHLLLDAPLNGARSVLLWNLVLGPHGRPHNGGCGDCRALFTLETHEHQIVLRPNVEFYILAHAAPFIHPGARLIETQIGSDSGDDNSSGVEAAAYRNLDGTFVVLVLNGGPKDKRFSIFLNGETAAYTVPQRSLVTFSWGKSFPAFEDGTYRLTLPPQHDVCLAASQATSEPSLQPCSAAPAQEWTLSRLTRGAFEVRNVFTAQDLALGGNGAMHLLRLNGDQAASLYLKGTRAEFCLLPALNDSCTPLAKSLAQQLQTGNQLSLLPIAAATGSDKIR